MVVAVEVFDRGNEPEIDGPGVETGGTRRRQVELDGEEIAVPLEPVDQRPRVQERDRTDPDGYAHRDRGAHVPSRSTGVSPADTMLRRTSSAVARRGPSPGSSIGETPSRSSAPTVSATWASLGP